MNTGKRKAEVHKFLYLRARSGKQKIGAQNGSIPAIETQLETFCFLLPKQYLQLSF